jgi:hypothetical protein
MEKSQNRRRNKNTIMHQRRCLLGLQRMLLVLDPATLLSHLNLSVHHLLVETQVPLTGEQAILQINSLDLSVLCARPNAYLIVFRKQISRLVGWHGRHLVLVHLVEMDGVVLRAE